MSNEKDISYENIRNRFADKALTETTQAKTITGGNSIITEDFGTIYQYNRQP